jgi:hypothetical protein
MKQSRAPGHFRVEFFVAGGVFFITKKKKKLKGKVKLRASIYFSQQQLAGLGRYYPHKSLGSALITCLIFPALSICLRSLSSRATCVVI